MSILLALVACRPEGSCVPADVQPADAAFAAILSDFSVGGLAFGDADGQLSELVLTTSGDAIVREVEGMLYVVGRGTEDTVAAVDPANPTAPVWEVALPQGANVHDLVGFAGSLWLPSFGLGELLVLDPADGALDRRIDLTSEAPDGNPDLDRALVLGDRLVVAAQQLEPEPGQPSLLTSEAGALLVLDAEGTLLDTVPTGPNPRIAHGPADTVLVSTGLFVFPGADPARDSDGELVQLDPFAGTSATLATESGSDFYTALTVSEQVVVLSIEADGTSTVSCIDPTTGTAQTWAGHPGWYITALDAGDGTVLLGSRSLDGVAMSGTLLIDAATCTRVARPSCSALPPYDFAGL